MQHFVYPEQQYRRTNAFGTLIVEHDPDNDMIRATITKNGGSMTIRLTPDSAAMLAGFLLSKHPAIVKGDAMAFSPVTRACDAIPEPDFTVITPGHELLAKPEKQDTTINVTAPDNLDAKRSTKTFADLVSRTWVAKDDEQEPDTGDLHPDQERRLTALREASKLLAGRLSNERLIEWAGWILYGRADTGKED